MVNPMQQPEDIWKETNFFISLAKSFRGYWEGILGPVSVFLSYWSHSNLNPQLREMTVISNLAINSSKLQWTFPVIARIQLVQPPCTVSANLEIQFQFQIQMDPNFGNWIQRVWVERIQASDSNEEWLRCVILELVHSYERLYCAISMIYDSRVVVLQPSSLRHL